MVGSRTQTITRGGAGLLLLVLLAGAGPAPAQRGEAASMVRAGAAAAAGEEGHGVEGRGVAERGVADGDVADVESWPLSLRLLGLGLGLSLLSLGGLARLRQPASARSGPQSSRGSAVAADPVPPQPEPPQAQPPRPEPPASPAPSAPPAASAAPPRAPAPLPPRAPLPPLRGRDREIAWLREGLRSPGTRVSITGRPGSGRHSLARLCDGAAVSLDAGRGFADLALQLLAEAHRRQPALSLPDDEDLDELLHRCWQGWGVTAGGEDEAGDGAAVLLILRDLPADLRGQAIERRFSRPLPPRARRLITQRSLSEPGGAVLELGGLDPRTARAWLAEGAATPAANRASDPDDPAVSDGDADADRAALVEQVQFQPFALALLAGRQRRRGSQDSRGLLQRLRQLEQEMRGSLPAASLLLEAPGAAATLQLIWHELAEPARHLALLLSALAPAPVPRALLQALLAAVDGSPGAGQAALRDLAAAGLLAAEAPELPGETDPGGELTLHPLVHEFLRLQRRSDASLDLTLRRTVAATLGSLAHARLAAERSLIDRLPLASLRPHLREVVQRERHQLADAELLWPVLGFSRLSEGLPPEPDEARLLQGCLEICEAVLGGDHPDTATALLNLAAFHDADGSGDPHAEALLERAVASRQRLLGPGHPATARALVALGQVLAGRGDHGRAIDRFEQALTIREALLGAESPALMGLLSRLADLHQAQGALARAEQIGRRILQTQERSLGAGHPDTAPALQRLAALQEAQGRPDRALPLYQQALAARRRQGGSDHPDTGTLLGRLASLALAQGRASEAETLHHEALAIFGREHPEAARCLQDLARLHQSRGDLEQAESLQREALALRQRRSGPQHPDTAAMLNDLGYLLAQRGRSREGLELCEQALAIRRRSFGGDHLEIASSLNTLAGLHESGGELDLAMELYQRALEITETQLGQDHPGTRTVRANLRGCSDALQREREFS